MSSNKTLSSSLQERIPLCSNLQRLKDLVILFLLFSLIAYRLVTLHSPISIIAFLCESFATFVWFLQINARWNPIAYKTYPQRFKKRFHDLPAVDMFVTTGTADPTLEPPIVTANTVLSLLAVDYPPHRIACYVSDDGGSPITYFAVREAVKFAKIWVPFCKRHSIQVRAPFVYFSTDLQPTVTLSSDFVHDWKRMKTEYIELARKIEVAARHRGLCHMDSELAEFSAIERGNHPSIIKVIWENKGEDDIPHLIYVAREKRPKHPHHFKAGAMNVLTRVSGVMTNAPFMLNVDCDMFANNPEVVFHAMCLLLGFDKEVSSGFVQAPQKFYGGLKDDPFGNQLVVLQNKFGFGIGGIQGPFYAGTGCFHRRKIIYGSTPEYDKCNDKLSYEQLRRIFGNSREIMESANEITSNKTLGFPIISDLSSKITAAIEVAACTYEFKTSWGQEIGWVYGSVTEDVLTGINIHARGWRSTYLTPEPPAFLGNAPTGGPTSLTQYKRWATGLCEILFGKGSPIHATLHKKLHFRQCLAYLWLLLWAPCALVEFIYALLPPYCFLTNSAFLPEASSPQFLIPSAIFTIYNLSNLNDYITCGLSARSWWNNQRMNRISSATAFLFGFLSVLLKLLGLSEMVFEVTKKDQSNLARDDVDEDPGSNVDPGRFTFDSSPLFVPGTTLVMVHIAGLATGAVYLLGGREHCWGVGEFICSAWLILSFWPFVRGLFGKGCYGIPWDIVLKAVGLGWIFMQLCGLIQ